MKKISILSLFLFCVGFLLSQNNYELKALQIKDAYDIAALTTYDLDDDGNKDVLIFRLTVYDEVNLGWYRNLGNGLFDTLSLIQTPYDGIPFINRPKNIILYDTDNDGDKDIFFDGQNICWIENTGSGTFSSQHIVEPIDGEYRINLGDMDGDGDNDIIASNKISYYDYNLYIYENTNQASFNPPTLINSDLNEVSKLLAVDVDNDNDQDIIIGESSFDGRLVLLKNYGNFYFGSLIIIHDDPIDDVEAADIDNDNDIDLAVSSGNVYWFENGGYGNYTAHSITNSFNGPDITISDIDNDNDLDITSTIQGSYWMVQCYNEGSQNFSVKGYIFDEIVGSVFVSVNDLNNDTNMDYVFSVSNELGDVMVAWGDESATFYNSKIRYISRGASNFKFFKTLDYNFDGTTDLITYSYDDRRLALYVKDTVSHKVLPQENIVNIIGFDGFQLEDMDSDNDIDILCSTNESQYPENQHKLYWLENDGEDNFQKQDIFGWNNGEVYNVYFQDIDNDGDNDILFIAESEVHETSKMYYMECIGPANYTSEQFLLDLEYEARYPTFIDIDGDQDIDILINEPYNLVWYENLGGWNIAIKHQIVQFGGMFEEYADFITCDIDNDGSLDIVSNMEKNSNDIFQWYKNDGYGNFIPRDTLENDFMYGLNAVYFDSDSNIDIVALHNNLIYWFKNNGNGNFAQKQLIYECTSNFSDESITMLKVDDDNSPDIVIAVEDWNRANIMWIKNPFGDMQIIEQPQSKTICEFSDVSFQINASSVDYYQWQYDSSNVFVNIANDIHFSGTNSENLNITNCNFDLNNRLFRCLIFNSDTVIFSDTVSLTINPVFQYLTFDTICAGDSLLWRGNYFSEAGQYFDTLTSLQGCDSIFQLLLTVNNICVVANTEYIDEELFINDTLTKILTLSNFSDIGSEYYINVEFEYNNISKSVEEVNQSILNKTSSLTNMESSCILFNGKDVDLNIKDKSDIINTEYLNSKTGNGIAIVLLGAEAYTSHLQDVQNKLIATGEFSSVTYINVSLYTPSLTELQAFNAALVWSYAAYKNNIQLGNVLADYVDNGGGVVNAMFDLSDYGTQYSLGGRWNDSVYYILPKSNYISGYPASLGNVLIPNHPLMSNISSFNGGVGYRASSSIIPEDAIVVAEWADGTPLILTKTINNTKRVELNMWPVSNDANTNGWDTATNGSLLISNALIWVSNGYDWLYTNPSSVFIEGNGTALIDLTFNSLNLNPDVYNANIIISNNNGQLTIPVTLNILSPLFVNLSVFLEGPFNSNQMTTSLNQNSLIPFIQPYNSPPWNYSGNESVLSIPNQDIVDWILVELRETQGTAASASSNTIVGTRAGFLLKNGLIVDLDGYSPLAFKIVPGNDFYYAVIRHRNHLDIMSAFPLTKNESFEYSYDFTISGESAFGDINSQNEVSSGIWAMFGGNAYTDKNLNNIDKNDGWIIHLGESGYYNSDMNMDGVVDTIDIQALWAPNSGRSSQIPE